MSQHRSKGSQNFEDAKEHGATEHPDMLVEVASLESALGNKPIFTRALIEQAALQVDQLRGEILQAKTNKPRTGKLSLRIPHLLGGGADVAHFPSSFVSPAVGINWLHTYRMAEKDGKIAPYRIREESDYFNQLIATVTLKPNDPDHPLRKEIAQMPAPPDLEKMKEFEAALLASPLWAGMKKRLDALQVEVKNIVCMALGSLYSHNESGEGSTNRLSRTTCTQHLLACAIAKYLSQRYHMTSSSASPSTSTSIPIIAYDPAYTRPALQVLSRLSPPITVVSDPYHYLSITPSTLVIVIGIPVFVPIHEIAADLCFPSGPAALLCNEIHTHPWHAEGKMACLDQRTPRVGRMLDLYEAEWLGGEFVGDEDEEEKMERRRKQGLGGWEEDMCWYARSE